MTAFNGTRSALVGSLLLAVAATSTATADDTLPGVGAINADPTVGVVEISTNPSEKAPPARATTQRPVGLFAYLRDRFDDDTTGADDGDTTGSIAAAGQAPKAAGTRGATQIHALIHKHAIANGVPP